MQNLNIIPNGLAALDDTYATIGSPPYIVAEGKLIAYYTAVGSGSGTTYTVAAASCPVGGPILDVDSKSVGTYQKNPRNQFQKAGNVIVPSAGIDVGGCYYPSAVYNAKEKKFMVYYIGEGGGAVLSIAMAIGKDFSSLAKHATAGGATIAIITPPAGVVIYLLPLQVLFDKEENLYKLYYYGQFFPGPLTRSYLATSKNGIDF